VAVEHEVGSDDNLIVFGQQRVATPCTQDSQVDGADGLRSSGFGMAEKDLGGSPRPLRRHESLAQYEQEIGY
jgi:hypothetical protein